MEKTRSTTETVLTVLAEYLNENGFQAAVETYSSRLPGDYHILSVCCKGMAVNMSLVDGNVRVGGFGKLYDIPLAMPDAFEQVLCRLNGEIPWQPTPIKINIS